MMRPRRPTVRIPFSVKIAIAFTICAIAVLLIGAGAFAISRPDPKAAFLQQVAAKATADANSPHAPKHPVAPPTSCPVTIVPGIVSDHAGEGRHDLLLTTSATIVTPQGAAFIVSAGALQADPQQGIMLVTAIDRDPCATQAKGQAPQSHIQQFSSPARLGALTITQISGETVLYTTESGVIGSFDYIAGQFS